MKRLQRHALLAIALSISTTVFADFKTGLDAYDRGDYETAFREWKDLSQLGNAIAQNRLGFLYENGQGVPQDFSAAAKWYSLAAEQGNAYAQFFLGMSYYAGESTPQNYTLAHMWMSIAASRGTENTVDMINGRTTLENMMTPSQISEAKKLAREWIARHGQ